MAKTKKKKEETQGDALVTIAEASPEALKMVGDVMEQASVKTVEILERQLQAEIAAHNETRRRLSVIRRQLDMVQQRILWLSGDAFPDDAIDEIEEVLQGRPE